MPFETWGVAELELARALSGLDDGDFLILGEPAPQPQPRRVLFGRTPKPAPTRYVQVLRVRELFSAEVVGAASLGGAWDMPEPMIVQLRSMGWNTPAESRAQFGNVTPNFGRFVDASAAPLLARHLVASLQLLGTHPHELELHTGR